MTARTGTSTRLPRVTARSPAENSTGAARHDGGPAKPARRPPDRTAASTGTRDTAHAAS
ncbi:hypothetical protein [Streptosporangium sp. H16]|uniref:hypothetical protein n=1 Tax=Streptosporangium sp. H16 TaxID=3444184 RepID=UPI003F78AF16